MKITESIIYEIPDFLAVVAEDDEGHTYGFRVNLALPLAVPLMEGWWFEALRECYGDMVRVTSNPVTLDLPGFGPTELGETNAPDTPICQNRR